MRLELVAERFQFAAQFRMVINFTVEDDRIVSVFGVHRLIAAGKIDNLQADCAEGNVVRFVNALLVRASMVQTLNSPVEHSGRRFSPEVGESRYSAHGSKSSNRPVNSRNTALYRA